MAVAPDMLGSWAMFASSRIGLREAGGCRVELADVADRRRVLGGAAGIGADRGQIQPAVAANLRQAADPDANRCGTALRACQLALRAGAGSGRCIDGDLRAFLEALPVAAGAHRKDERNRSQAQTAPTQPKNTSASW